MVLPRPKGRKRGPNTLTDTSFAAYYTTRNPSAHQKMDIT